MVFVKTYGALPVCEREVLRYAGWRGGGPSPELLRACMDEAAGAFACRVCWSVFDLRLCGDRCGFGAFAVDSADLARRLQGCGRAVVFAATAGVGIDRLIAKYGAVSPSKALLFQALGAEKVEALCDAFCADLAAGLRCRLRPRFSPGYGDLGLACQRDIFAVLNCEKHVGLTLTESLLMSPSKSVTAIVGLGDTL